MAAYAALVSLMNTINNIKNHPHLPTSLDDHQIESFVENLDFLLNFIESYDSDEDFESQIASAANRAEDAIESHIMDQIIFGSTEESHSFLLDLQKMIEDMDSIKKKVMEVKEGRLLKDHEMPTYSSHRDAALSRAFAIGETTMVGFDGYVIRLLEELTGQQSNRRIIPITGMGGIGKTTLARNVYENLLIVQHFDVRAWVTVSQGYNVREIVLETLSSLRESTSEMDGETDDPLAEQLYKILSDGMEKESEAQLGEQLYKVLCGWRYLVVLDDMWSIEAWNKIKSFFPDNYNRSRIIVTTRLLEVGNNFGYLGFRVNFLDDDKSWGLFCDKAFAQEGCPSELEEIGKKIVRRCKGLPLSIVVIGGLLGKSSRMQEYWENVAKDISPILESTEDNQCLDILSLSYSHLPASLKPCFLYFGMFPEDHDVRVSRLTKLWVAEGFLKPSEDRSLEEVAEDHLNDLIDRNLILIRSFGSNGKIKSCYIHDLLRDLCLKISKKEKFFRYTRDLDNPCGIDRERRIIIQESTEWNEYPWKVYHPQLSHILKSTSLARSLICKGVPVSIQSSMLRVLFGVHVSSLNLDATFHQVNNMRFLSDESSPVLNSWIRTYKIPSSMSLLWNVQTLIIGKVYKAIAPSEIWEMPQLRHLKFHSISLPDPPMGDKQHDFVGLWNLQTLERVQNFRCTEEACKRIPNLKKLSVVYDDFSGEGKTKLCYYLENIGHLNKLESLNYSFVKVPNRIELVQNLTFPSSLRKLTLENCELDWNDLTIIGFLPFLEVLKLRYNSVTGSDWNPIERQFHRLKFLGIYWCYGLTNWVTDSSHFPILENLVLDSLSELNEIPLGIGEISTLQRVCVYGCSISTAISAIKMLEEQESLGNSGLQVQLVFIGKREAEEFKEKVELQGLTSLNFQILEGRDAC